MWLLAALQSPFSFYLGCSYAKKNWIWKAGRPHTLHISEYVIVGIYIDKPAVTSHSNPSPNILLTFE